MSVKISEDPATDFKNLVSLMKDANGEDEEGEGDGNDSDENDGQLLN